MIVIYIYWQWTLIELQGLQWNMEDDYWFTTAVIENDLSLFF